MAKKQQAEPAAKTFEEIMAERLPKQPTTRERLAAATDARAEARKKIAAQEKKQAARKKRNARILARHGGRMTSEFYRDVAEADRAEATR